MLPLITKAFIIYTPHLALGMAMCYCFYLVYMSSLSQVVEQPFVVKYDIVLVHINIT